MYSLSGIGIKDMRISKFLLNLGTIIFPLNSCGANDIVRNSYNHISMVFEELGKKFKTLGAWGLCSMFPVHGKEFTSQELYKQMGLTR